MTDATTITTEDALRERLGSPMDLAKAKAIPYLDKYCKAFIERAPFLTLSTSDAQGRLVGALNSNDLMRAKVI